MKAKPLPAEGLVDLRRRLSTLSPHSAATRQVIAALKLRTTNKQGRHLSTAEAIRLLEVHGVDTPSGFLQAPAAVLKKSTVDRY